ncbi:RimK family alpha-L-glutamate ligase [Amycolatopsis sp. lyj-109]|uniref:ATP-grasp domain-containing protein n=1 Tax=Amycolatopsis sp. lyj-109 TaxID=2789287 RepID=UPI003979FA70
MILCLGVAADPTFTAGLRALRRAGIPFRPVDLPSLAMRGKIRIPLDSPADTVLSLDGESHRVGDFAAIWCRLVEVASAAPTPELAAASAGQTEALARILEFVPLKVMNPPLREASGFTKLLHAVTLGEVGGWQIPATCLTTDPEEALEFVRGCRAGAIFKGASATKTWATVFEPHHESRLPRLVHLPVLFQERIVGPDVRIHVVGDQSFGELIDSPVLDYRTVRGVNDYRTLVVPPEIAEGCARLTGHCRVPLLGVDFKIERATGQWFFLEANSMPCFEGYDERAGGAVSRAIAEWLAGA